MHPPSPCHSGHMTQEDSQKVERLVANQIWVYLKSSVVTDVCITEEFSEATFPDCFLDESSLVLFVSLHSTIQLFLIRCVSSWLSYSSSSIRLFLHPTFFWVSFPIRRCPVSVLRPGHGGEDQTDEAEDEQVQARSRLGLQAGAGLPQGNTLVHKPWVWASLPPAAATYGGVCMDALRHMVHFASSQA